MNKDARESWGSIRQRGKGVWQIRYTVGGEPKSETVRGTKKEAAKRKAELWLEYGDREAPMSLDEFYESKFKPWMESELAPKTVESYDSQYLLHIKREFGHLMLDEIRPRQIQDWILTMNYAVAKHAKVVLSSIMSRAFALEQIDDNPVHRRFQMPDPETSAKRNEEVYSHDELDEIAEACKGEPWEGCFLFAAFGGGQRSEVDGIRLDEIDEIDGCAVAPVRRGVHYTRGEVLIRNHAKNVYREEFIVVTPPHAERALEFVEERLKAGDTWLCDDGFGGPMNPMTMAQNYQRWFSRQPFKYIPFKNLRPSYATWMRDEGYSVDDVSRLLRHSTDAMLKRVYDRPRAQVLVGSLMQRHEKLANG